MSFGGLLGLYLGVVVAGGGGADGCLPARWMEMNGMSGMRRMSIVSISAAAPGHYGATVTTVATLRCGLGCAAPSPTGRPGGERSPRGTRSPSRMRSASTMRGAGGAGNCPRSASRTAPRTTPGPCFAACSGAFFAARLCGGIPSN